MSVPIEITVLHVMAVMDLKYSTDDIATKSKRYNENHGDIVMRAIKENPSGNIVPLKDIAKRANEIRQEFLDEINGVSGERNENT